MMGNRFARWAGLCVALGLATVAGAQTEQVEGEPPPDAAALEADREPVHDLPRLHLTPCIGGFAGPYPCQSVDLLAFLPLADIGGGNGSDIWGWTDPDTGHEYALVGKSTGLAFVDITDAEHPTYLGDLPAHNGVTSTWRDVETYDHYAVVVSEASGHGMQIFDLHQLRNVVAPPVTFTATARYAQFNRAHTVAVDEESGFAYAVGSREGTQTCGSGLHMVSLANPTAPAFAGCYGGDGYTHETQCVHYHGPDTAYQNHQVCFAANEDTLTLVDVTNKAAPVQISRTAYPGVGYTHQGWLTEDQRYFLLDDELDEQGNGHPTRTVVWDVSNLDAPVVVGSHFGSSPAIDHNQYVRGDFVYQSNYRAGLRILHLDDLATATLSEVAFFDIYPANNQASFNGAWGVYPFFPSGNVIISGIEQGLFVVRPALCTTPAVPAGLTAAADGEQAIELTWTASPEAGTVYTVERALGTCESAGAFLPVATGLAATGFVDAPVSGQVTWAYRVVASDPTGLCPAEATACTEASTTGACTAPPQFAGLASVTNPAGATCRLDLAWPAATPSCGSTVTYRVYRDVGSDVVPSPATLRASGLISAGFADSQVTDGVDYAYRVLAVDGGSGTADANPALSTGRPTGPAVDGTWTAGAEFGDPPPVFGLTGAAGTVGAVAGGPEHVGWHLSTTQAHSGLASYFSTYANSQCSALTLPPVTLSTGQAPELSLWTRYLTEPGFDGGVVEISADGGQTWGAITPTGGYPGAFGQSTDTCGFATGRGAFIGQAPAWTRFAFDLSGWAGMTVQVRFLFSTDGGLTDEGWYVDDVALTHAQVAGTCTAVVFADGFETGGLEAWSAAVP